MNEPDVPQSQRIIWKTDADILLSLALLLEYRRPMQVSEVKIFPTFPRKTGYYVCPRCKITMDREFMAFCDRCGQCLDWHGYRNAKVIHIRKN